MPYFERKTYADTIAEATQTVPAQMSEEVSILDMAHSVLAEETQPSAAVDGPFRSRRPAQPGGQADIRLELSAEPGAGEPVSVNLAAGDLTGTEGGVIPSGNIALTPSRLTLRPGTEPVEVRLSVAVPPDCAPGTYTGRIDVSGDDRFAIAIEVDVSG